MFSNRSGAIVPFQSDRHLPVHQPRRSGQQFSGGRGIRSNVVGHAPNVAASILRYFDIDLHRLPEMSDQELAGFADRAHQMKQLRKVLPILEKHFEELIEGQLEYEQFIQKFLKTGGAAAQKIDKGILDAWLLSQGYNHHLKLMGQQANLGTQKQDAEFQSQFSLNQLDFQTAMQIVKLRRQSGQQRIREKVPQYLYGQQIAEQQRLKEQQRRDLLTYGTQNQPQRKSFFQNVASFFGG